MLPRSVSQFLPKSLGTTPPAVLVFTFVALIQTEWLWQWTKLSTHPEKGFLMAQYDAGLVQKCVLLHSKPKTRV